jgi:hypothetical protein
MLHISAVPLNLLEVLSDLQSKIEGYGFALAGGTSLALRFGHRLSIDLDFFTEAAFEPPDLANLLAVGPESITGSASGTLQIQLRKVKVEFLRHSYPPLAPKEFIQNIHFWSLQDVAAMKLNAICNRGSKKDFYDIRALLKEYDLHQLIQWYGAKYQPASSLMLVRSLSWFEDADAEPDPISLINESWDEVKSQIKTAIRSLS